VVRFAENNSKETGWLGTMRRLAVAGLSAAWLGRTAEAAFGLSSKASSWSVDTNAGLVFEVSK